MLFCIANNILVSLSIVNAIKVCQKSSYFSLPPPMFQIMEILQCIQNLFIIIIIAEREIIYLCEHIFETVFKLPWEYLRIHSKTK